MRRGNISQDSRNPPDSRGSRWPTLVATEIGVFKTKQIFCNYIEIIYLLFITCEDQHCQTVNIEDSSKTFFLDESEEDQIKDCDQGVC